MSDLARFLAKVDTTAGIFGCWLWTGARNDTGYGRFAFKGRNVHAHRVVYQLLVGPIPPGLFVCHTCDNPPCVNPAHLWLGTNADNAADRDAKGRNVVRRGEATGQAKLTEAHVRAIRQSVAAGASHVEVGARFGVSETSIRNVIYRVTWRHVA